MARSSTESKGGASSSTRYVRALHGVREPWGLSVYDMRAQLLGLEAARTEFRFRGAAIEALGKAAARQAAEDLADYARLGGLTLTVKRQPVGALPDRQRRGSPAGGRRRSMRSAAMRCPQRARCSSAPAATPACRDRRRSLAGPS